MSGWIKEVRGEPVAWLLTDNNINDLQVATVQRLIDRAKQAHYVDLVIRINGKDEHYQADWLKHLVRHAVPACTRRTGLNGELCGLKPPCPDCGRACHDVPEGA